MTKRRGKITKIALSSIMILVFSYALFLTTDTNAKEFDPPGQKIKQIVHEYNNLRKANNAEHTDTKEELKVLKKEIIKEVKSAKDERVSEKIFSETIPQEPTPTKKPIIKLPAITPPTNTSPIPSPTTTLPNPTIFPERSLCAETGGTWAMLPNSCVDSCALITNPELMCLQVITEGCDCGSYACWGGNGCIKNTEIVKPLPTTEPTPTKAQPRPLPEPIDPPICIGGNCDPLFPIY